MYVRVLEKALLECRPDLVIDWVGEAHAWLTRRNELLVAHKAHMPNKDIKTAATKHIEVFRCMKCDMFSDKGGGLGGNHTPIKFRNPPQKLETPPEISLIFNIPMLKRSFIDTNL